MRMAAVFMSRPSAGMEGSPIPGRSSAITVDCSHSTVNIDEQSTVIALDMPGIGESSIPADGLDMKTAAIRIHALAKSLGVEKARVVGHDRPRNARNGSITFHHDQYPA